LKNKFVSQVLHIIGVGPGDPELLTVKAVNTLRRCGHIFTPIARTKSESIALTIAQASIGSGASIHRLHFPMVCDSEMLAASWAACAAKVAAIMKEGEEAAFLTLGDPMVYSTAIYLIAALREAAPGIAVRIVPGIPAFCAVAALTGVSLGEGKMPISILPATDDLVSIREATRRGGTVVVMKVGERLGDVIDLLEEINAVERAVFVAHAGQKDERIETDIRKLRDAGKTAGYLSIILIRAEKGAMQ
jgi:precorrin-2/cobalt-factor-2 C20-methyltransferase